MDEHGMGIMGQRLSCGHGSVGSGRRRFDMLRKLDFFAAGKVRFRMARLPKGESFGNIEGELLVIDGKLHNIMRYSMENLQRKYGLVVDYLVDTARPDAPLKYNGCIEFPCNNSKFEMMYDEVSGKYIAIGSRIYDETKLSARNLLSLLVSDDGKKWRVASDIIDKRAEDCTKVGFQYISMAVEGDDLVFLCRTAMNGADSYHNSNYITFHRIKDFRRLIN